MNHEFYQLIWVNLGKFRLFYDVMIYIDLIYYCLIF